RDHQAGLRHLALALARLVGPPPARAARRVAARGAGPRRGGRAAFGVGRAAGPFIRRGLRVSIRPAQAGARGSASEVGRLVAHARAEATADLTMKVEVDVLKPATPSAADQNRKKM